MRPFLHALATLAILGGPALAAQASAPAPSPGEAEARLQRFYGLRKEAKDAFTAGNLDRARALGEELLALAPGYAKDWNYGNAIHDGHMVLGRVALRRGDVDAAKRHLDLAGRTPGSPQLDSFGPNMGLAKDLLEKGEKEAVLAYFQQCGRFWGFHQDRLDAWTADVKAGRLPDFRANLVY